MTSTLAPDLQCTPCSRLPLFRCLKPGPPHLSQLPPPGAVRQPASGQVRQHPSPVPTSRSLPRTAHLWAPSPNSSRRSSISGTSLSLPPLRVLTKRKPADRQAHHQAACLLSLSPCRLGLNKSKPAGRHIYHDCACLQSLPARQVLTQRQACVQMNRSPTPACLKLALPGLKEAQASRLGKHILDVI